MQIQPKQNFPQGALMADLVTDPLGQINKCVVSEPFARFLGIFLDLLNWR
jgi:hypothetical protein